MPYTFTPLEPAQHLQLDLFPATVSSEEHPEPFPNGDKRVIITDAHLYVFTDGVENVNVLVQKPITSVTGSTLSGYEVETEDGMRYHVIRVASCGCGSRLRGFHPFPGLPYAPITK